MLNHSIFTYALAQGQNLPLMREESGTFSEDVSFCAGVPFLGGRALHTNLLAPVSHWHNGMPFCSNSALATSEGPAVTFVQGSLGITADGRIAVSIGGTATHFSRGFPFDDQGRIVTPPVTPPVNTHAFSLGFDQGAFS